MYITLPPKPLPGGKQFRVLRPFYRLRTVMIWYGVIFVSSLGVMAFGLSWLASPLGGLETRNWGSGLHSAVVALEVLYWIMALFMGGSLAAIKMDQRKGKGKGGKASGKKCVIARASEASAK